MDHIDATLRYKLILLEQKFLIAVGAHDEAALKDFYQKWSLLFRHFQAVEASGGLDDGTVLLLSHVSQAIRATTKCMLECEDISIEAQTSSLNGSSLCLSPDDMFSASTNLPPPTPYHLLFSRVPSCGALGILGQNKHLDARAYHWLMQNMHNPYPSSVQLQIIGGASDTSVEQVVLWFQEARDSVGWTRLSHEFFTGSINATITMAKRVYLEHDNTVPFRTEFAFLTVKAFMETLFLEESALPASLVASHVGYAARATRSLPTGQDHHFN